MSRAALWRVQARRPGEPWTTLSRHLVRTEAEAAAAGEAARRWSVPTFDGKALPYWTDVRLAYRELYVAIKTA